MNILLSVIIPAHNTGKYISRCLDSVINQTAKNLEILIVNDASTDNSQNIIAKYANKYKNIHFFTTKMKSGPGEPEM